MLLVEAVGSDVVVGAGAVGVPLLHPVIVATHKIIIRIAA
jgi:hypothetical protein